MIWIYSCQLKEKDDMKLLACYFFIESGKIDKLIEETPIEHLITL